MQVSRPGGGFRITAEPVLLHDETEVQQLLEGLGEKAQVSIHPLSLLLWLSSSES